MEVVDILHRLTFETNPDVLAAVNKEFGTQIKQMQELKQKELEYSQLLERTAQTDIKNRKVIEGLLSKNKAQYDALAVSVGKQFAANENLNTSLVKTGKNLHSLTFAGAQLLREAPAFTFSIQTGILALSNNIPILIDQLNAARAAGSSTTDIFKALGQSVFSMTGLLTIGVSVLTIFGDKIFDVKSEAEKAADAIERISKETDKLRKEVKSFSEANYSDTIDENIGKSIEADKRRVESLRASGASAERILDAENIVRRRQIAQINDEIKLYETRETSIIRFDKEIYELKQRRADLEAEIENKGIELERKRAEEREEQLKKAREAYERLRDAIRAVNREIATIEYSEFERGAKAIEDAAKAYERMFEVLEKRYPGVGTPGFLQQGPARTDLKTPEELAAEKKIRQDDEKRLKDAEERNKESIKNSLDYALNTTVQTLQSIYDMQIYYLDLEIAARQTRVDQAVELAEKGNTEILESERERLIEAQNERERIGQKQLQLNALLQASSAAIAATQAIQTVTNAGATGDPYTAAARIAAAVAALAAGFAFVTNLTQAFKSGFKDGVIGLEGPGTTTSDSIPAMLSRGESVMTAKETAAYRPYLEAMRNGNFDRMIKTHEPISATGGNSYRTLEKKLDGVIDAIEGNKVIARQSMDKHGIIQVIETVKRHERAKWL